MHKERNLTVAGDCGQKRVSQYKKVHYFKKFTEEQQPRESKSFRPPGT